MSAKRLALDWDDLEMALTWRDLEGNAISTSRSATPLPTVHPMPNPRRSSRSASAWGMAGLAPRS